MTTTPSSAATPRASGERPWTPGPWTARPRRHDPQQWSIDADNGDPTLGHSRWQGLAVYGCDDMPEEGAAVAEANAYLIAASPELAEAAADVLSYRVEGAGLGYLRDNDASREALSRLAAALAAATQREAGDAGRPQDGEAK